MHRKVVSRLTFALMLSFLFSVLPENCSGSIWSGLNGAHLVTSNELHLSVPFYYQEKDYYCGPATLEMVFNYYGENISQSEIACVARSIGDPLYVTYTDELRRAGHFSNMSTSMGGELPANITGYALRQLGYAASEAQGMNLTTLKDFLDHGNPLILLMWYSSRHVSTHYRVATGYNDTHVFLHDPWNKPLWGGTYGGPDLAFNNSQFLDLWSYFNYWTLYVSPWAINISLPKFVTPGASFQVQSTLTYSQALPNALSAYPASSCNASIILPANLSLAQGESQKKTAGTGLLQEGESCSLNWTLVANSSVTGTISITAEGLISGSVPPSPNYTAYNYIDRIGSTVNFTVDLPTSVHDIALTGLVPSKTVAGRSYGLNVTVTVANQGSYTEDFNITVFANDTAMQTSNASLKSTDSTKITFFLNTSSLSYGNYTISAYAPAVPDETDTTNNNLTCTVPVHVGVPGDVSGTSIAVYDGKTNMRDVAYMITLFNTKPSSQNWNPNADVNNDGTCNMRDIAIAIFYFNQHE